MKSRARWLRFTRRCATTCTLFTAGRVRANDQPIYTPPRGGAARADDLFIRWNPWSGVDRVTISVWSKTTQQRFCCDGEFDGKKGALESSELQKALIPLQDRNPNDRQLFLNVSASLLRDFTVQFTLLSGIEERQLEIDLAAWENKDPLLRHLGRAHVFSTYRLFTQAAEESESALALEPDSPYLLVVSIEAERQTGNSKPLDDLKRRLTMAQKKAIR